MGAASRPWASWPSMGGGLRVGERGAGPCQPQLGLGQPCRGAGHLRQRGLETPLTRACHATDSSFEQPNDLGH